MCSTPAPPSTAFVASSIWSGVGEVNTSPGQAASSMPRPTKPPCIGSRPEPPPATRPPAARDEPDLALDRGVGTNDDVGAEVDFDEVRMRCGETLQRLGDDAPVQGK